MIYFLSAPGQSGNTGSRSLRGLFVFGSHDFLLLMLVAMQYIPKYTH